MKKLLASGLAAIIVFGMVYTHPAYAHNFGGDESATWLAKVAEIKTEVSLVAKHVGDSESIDYYADALGEYWGVNDTNEMAERNTLLAQEIPSAINNTLDDARKSGMQSMVNDDVSKLNGYLDESVPVRVDADKLNNSTIQTLAVTFVLQEALEKYGDAINSTKDLNDMSQMDMSGTQTGNMQGMSGNMQGMSMVPIVDDNAYENSIGLATAAQNMFNDIAAKNPDKSDANTKASAALAKFIQDINGKADGNTVMTDIHMNFHPAVIEAYNLPLVSKSEINNPGSAVPEFPLPILLIIISITAVIAITRLKGYSR